MSKIKTHKATAKRFKIKRSRKGTKIMKRTDGQDHFNARETGKTKRNKRTDKTMSNRSRQTIMRSMPNS